ncbi:hypothetical protein ACQ3HE_06820 [Plantibacter auratus]|uniref:hypothetical protein n=1 Tax=Plantibacter auratus TaxID=272914 RepID=UPI003D34BE28
MSNLSERVESRLRAEWPGTHIPLRMAHAPSKVTAGGATDTMIKLAARIVAEEEERADV